MRKSSRHVDAAAQGIAFGALSFRQVFGAVAARARLVQVAADLFATRPYDDISMEEVAALGGVSRALLYRHFPGKRELFAVVYQRASNRLLAQAAPDPDIPFMDQIDSGLDAYIDYFATHSNIVLTANRNLAGDTEIQAILQTELELLRARIAGFAGVDTAASVVVSAALMGWLRFAHAACAEWLTVKAFDRAELKQMCLGALLGALGAHLDLSRRGMSSGAAGSIYGSVVREG